MSREGTEMLNVLGSDVTAGGAAVTVLADTATGRNLARHRLEY